MTQNPDPIQQKIEIDADTSGAEDASRALGEVSQATSKASREAKQAGSADQRREQQARELKAELRELIGIENTHASKVREGKQASDEEQIASLTRRQEIDRLSRSLAKLEDEQEQVNREMRESVNAHRRSKQSADENSESHGFLSNTLKGVRSSAVGMIGGFFGIQTVIEYVNKLNQAADQTIDRLTTIAEKANEAASATLDLQAINLGFSERDEQAITNFSKASGRSFQDSARAYTNFKSQTASFSADKQESLFNEAVLPYALTTSGSIEPAAKFIGRAAKVTDDPKELTNLMIKSIGLAGESDPAQFLDYAGKLLVEGKDAGLTPAETLSQLGYLGDYDVSESSTGLRNIFSKLTSDAATRERLSELGIDCGQGLFSTYQQLSDRGTTREEINDLVGIENARFLSSIVGNIEDVNSRRQQTTEAVAGDDLIANFNRDLANKSPRHALALQNAQKQQELAATRREDGERAQQYQLARTQVEIDLERAVQVGTLDASAAEARLERFDKDVGGGITFDLKRPAYDAARGLIAQGKIPLTENQQQRVDSGSLGDLGQSAFYLRDILPNEQISYQQLLAAAAYNVQDNNILTDVIPGGDRSNYVEIGPNVVDELQSGPRLPSNKKSQENPDNPIPAGTTQPGPDEAPERNATDGAREQTSQLIDAVNRLTAQLAYASPPVLDRDAPRDRQLVFQNLGTINSQGGDALLDDLDGRDRV